MESDEKSQKRKTAEAQGSGRNGAVDTSKPTAVFRPTKGRQHTLSVALPGSIIANAQTHDLKTALAGHIARACAVFGVDEVIIFDDGQTTARPREASGYTAFADPAQFLARVLAYLETPPHLRRALFAMHPDLRTAGALPSLDMPHHLRAEEWCAYREGVAVAPAAEGGATELECGLPRRVRVPVRLDEGTRVTVRLPAQRPSESPEEEGLVLLLLEGEAVSPAAPREEAGYYWGYGVRRAASLAAVFTECPHDGGYDVSVGTSERGTTLDSIRDRSGAAFVEPTWDHLLIVLGGVAGLEAAFAADAELQAAGVGQASEVFDRWVNLVPGQGSRTIRTEEALWLALMGLSPLMRERAEV